MSESIRHLLDYHGFVVNTSRSLLDATNAMVAIEYDLILLDLRLEDGCGFALMDHVNEKKLDTRVIVITGHHSENNAIVALKKGATDYLKKPFEPDDLVASVNRVLGQQEQQRWLCLFKTIVDAYSEAIIVGDLGGRVVYSNAAYRKLIVPEALERSDPPVIQAPLADENVVVDEQIRKSLETGIPWMGRVDMVNAAGQRLAMWKRAEALPDRAGDATYGFASMHAFVSRTENEWTVTSSRERYRQVIDSHKDYVCRLNREFEITFANKAYADCWGKTPRAMIGLPFMTFVQDSTGNALFNSLVVARSGSTPIEIELTIVDAHDRIRWQQWQFHGILDDHGRVSEIQCIGRDVTQKKRVERDIEANREKFRNLAEITSDWIWEVDISGVYTYASPVVYDLLGYHPEEVVGKRPFDFMPEDEAKRLENIYQQALTEGKAFRNIENINLHKNGSRVTLETSGVPVFDYRGMVIGFRGIDRNISSRKHTEKRLLEESKKLKQALNKVKHLSGMLPICASCKRIRDDKGYWNQIEAYITNHSEAEFSHGICPACARKLYPELYPEEE